MTSGQARVQQPAPHWSGTAVIGDEFVDISLDQYRGKEEEEEEGERGFVRGGAWGYLAVFSMKPENRREFGNLYILLFNTVLDT